MSELRDRIAAALKARDEAATAGIDDPFLVEHASYDELADAVIAELGLKREEALHSLLPEYERNTVRMNVWASRYVTDWKADDERPA